MINYLHLDDFRYLVDGIRLSSGCSAKQPHFRWSREFSKVVAMSTSRLDKIVSISETLSVNLFVFAVTFFGVATVVFVVGAPEWIGVAAAGLFVCSLFGCLGALLISTVLPIFTRK